MKFFLRKKNPTESVALFQGWVLDQDLDSDAQLWTGPYSAGACQQLD